MDGVSEVALRTIRELHPEPGESPEAALAKDNLMFEKVWHDRHMVELRAVAASDLACASVSFYAGYEDVREKGRLLEEFDPGDETTATLEFGGKAKGGVPDFSMKAVPLGTWDDAVRIEVDLRVEDGGGSARHRCCFGLRCGAAELAGLGRGLAALADLPVGSACSLLPGDSIGLSFPLRPREHLSPRNSMGIVLPYGFASGAARLSWSDVLAALRGGYLRPEDAVAHAVAVLGERSPQEALDLAIMEPWEAADSEAVVPLVEKLAQGEGRPRREEALDKLNYLVLKWVFENGAPRDGFRATELVYEDFFHPASMKGFVEYEASSPGAEQLLPGESLQDRMRSNWKDYLDREASRFSDGWEC